MGLCAALGFTELTSCGNVSNWKKALEEVYAITNQKYVRIAVRGIGIRYWYSSGFYTDALLFLPTWVENVPSLGSEFGEYDS